MKVIGLKMVLFNIYDSLIEDYFIIYSILLIDFHSSKALHVKNEKAKMLLKPNKIFIIEL